MVSGGFAPDTTLGRVGGKKSAAIPVVSTHGVCLGYTSQGQEGYVTNHMNEYTAWRQTEKRGRIWEEMAEKIVTLYIDDTSLRLLATDGKRVTKWADSPLKPRLVKDGSIIEIQSIALAKSLARGKYRQSHGSF